MVDWLDPEEEGIPFETFVPELEEGEIGRFDLISCFGCLNATKEELILALRFDQKDAPVRINRLRRALLHERFHFLQVLSSGYLYGVISVIGKQLVETVNSPTEDSEIHPVQLAIDQAIDGFKVLHYDDRFGLSVWGLMECSARCYEWRVCRDEGDKTPLREFIMSSEGGPEYRRAFEYATAVVPNLDAESFIAGAAYSLGYSEPTKVFPSLVDLFVRLRSGSAVDIKAELLDIQKEAGCIDIGRGLDVRDELTIEERWPLYEAPMDYLRKLGIDPFRLTTMMDVTQGFEVFPCLMSSIDKSIYPAIWQDDLDLPIRLLFSGIGLKADPFSI